MAIISSQQGGNPYPRGKKRSAEVESATPSVTQSELLNLPSDVREDHKRKNNLKGENGLSLLQAVATPEDDAMEAQTAQPQASQGIRPRNLTEYIGQKDLKALLDIAIAAAKSRQTALDHLLLYGPPGLGKTSLALIIATEMGVQCKITSAPALERPRDVAGLLVSLQAGDILFIDEIHRLNPVAEEILYPAMEDYRLDITIGKGHGARHHARFRPQCAFHSNWVKSIYLNWCNHTDRSAVFAITGSIRLCATFTILRTGRVSRNRPA